MARAERETAGPGVVRLLPDGRCPYVNDRLCKIVGWSREELLGLGWMRRVPPQIGSQLPERWDELRAGRRLVSVDTFLRPDGRKISLEFEAMPELDAAGRVSSIIITCVDAAAQRDQTAEESRIRKQATSRLEELESIYRNAPIGLSFVDRDLRYIRVNQMLADMNGVSIEEMVGRSYRDLSPETADSAEPFLRRLMERGEPVRNLEVRSPPPADPEVVHDYLLNLDPVRDERGEVFGHVAAVLDVTDLRRAQDAAARRLEELEVLYANLPVALCHMDTGLRIVHLNPTFARLSDRAPGEQVGASLPELLPEHLGRQLLPQLRYVIRTGAASEGLVIRGRVAGADTCDYTWIARTHPMQARDGEVRGIITVLQDVTLLADRQRQAETVRDRLAEAQHVALVGSWEWNLLEDEMWWSPELYEIFGEERTVVPSYVSFFEHVHPGDRAKVRQQVERALSESRPDRMTVRIVRSDGSERALFTAAQLERTAGGAPARLVGTCQDVTLPSLRPHAGRRRGRHE